MLRQTCACDPYDAAFMMVTGLPSDVLVMMSVTSILWLHSFASSARSSAVRMYRVSPRSGFVPNFP